LLLIGMQRFGGELLLSHPGHSVRLYLTDEDHPQKQNRGVRHRLAPSAKIPFWARSSRKSIVARTTRTLGTLIASGVPILEG
jgi:type II secretory pathway component PulF